MQAAKKQSFIQQYLIPSLPSLIAGGIAWLMFIVIGQTPPIRAAALASVIAGMALVLRPMGGGLAVIGALALALSPAYWAQTGGSADAYHPLVIGGGAAACLLLGARIVRSSRRPALGIGIGAAALVTIILIAQYAGIGGARSLRLTTLLTMALLYLLTDALRVSNPRPDSPPSDGLKEYHWLFLLGTFALGIINDPMITLFAPALLLAIFLTRATLHPALWAALIGVIVFGLLRLVNVYIDADYWAYPAQQAIDTQLRVPFLIGGAWREAERWITLIGFVTSQFTPIGVALGVVGLARLARWYPPLGVVSLVAFGSYALFGLAYFGGDTAVLLLPMLMIEVLWITYALATVRDWLSKLAGNPRNWRRVQNSV
ncbi:MAG: hypothetical protein U0670_05890 [Anaerolineae bacterium]